MEANIIILSTDAKLAVSFADFLSELKKEEYITVNSDSQQTRGIGAFLVKIFNTVGLTSLVKGIRNFFGPNELKLTCTDSNGKKIELEAKGRDLDTATVIGYISGNLKKDVIEDVEKIKIEYPLEVKLGLETSGK